MMPLRRFHGMGLLPRTNTSTSERKELTGSKGTDREKTDQIPKSLKGSHTPERVPKHPLVTT